MNILVLSWRGPKHPNAGGAEQVMHEHMKGWVGAGHKVTFFSSHFEGGKRNETLDGIKIIRKGYQILGVQIAAFFWYLFDGHPEFDLVVDQFHGIPFSTPLYVRTKKLAVLQEVAREVWFLNHLPKPLNWLVGFLGYISEPFIFLFYKKVPFMTGSESAKRDLVAFGIPENNIHIVPHGVIMEKSKVKSQKSKMKTVVFLGALTRDKGIEDAIRSFSILNQKGKFRFWVVGKGNVSYTTYLEDLCRKLGVSGKVKFWGFVSSKRKFELLARAHVLVNSSVREGWGLVNIEANAVGTPVVAYNSPGLIDSVKDEVSGIVCKDNSSQAMAEEVIGLVGNKERYKRLSQGAISWSRKFSWEKSRKESLGLIKKITKTTA